MEIKTIRVGDFPLGEDEKKAILNVIESGKITEGIQTENFELEFAKYIGTKYAVCLNSGTSSLIAGLEAIKIAKNIDLISKNKIITTPTTYIATSNAIVKTGFDPIYVDIDINTFSLQTDKIKEVLESTLSDKIALILPVHLFGFPNDMKTINKLANKNNIYVFEDSAQAHGTTIHGKKVGSLSDLSDFSFYIAHNVQAGELGALTTNDAEIARLVRKIKANGRMCDCLICKRSERKCPKVFKDDKEEDFGPRFTHDIIGYNFKTMEFQTALARVQLKKIDEITKKRYENVKILNDGLSKFEDILQLPPLMKNVSYMVYPIVIKNSKIRRIVIRKNLEKYGIETRPIFGCIPTQQPAYESLKKEYSDKLPNAEFVGKNGFYIGCHQYLSDEDLEYIINTFKIVLKDYRK